MSAIFPNTFLCKTPVSYSSLGTSLRTQKSEKVDTLTKNKKTNNILEFLVSLSSDFSLMYFFDAGLNWQPSGFLDICKQYFFLRCFFLSWNFLATLETSQNFFKTCRIVVCDTFFDVAKELYSILNRCYVDSEAFLTLLIISFFFPR